MKLVRTSHPNPKWTMAYLSEVMYKEGSKKSMMACKAEWVRDKEELIELLNLPQLGNYEWKDEARKLLREIEKMEKKDNPTVALTVNGIYGRERITNYDHELPPNYTVNDMQNNQFMPRYRYFTKPIVEDPCENDSLKYDKALFIPNVGLVGIWTDFWHTDYKKTGTVHADRAVLFQSVENYEILKNDPKFESCFDKHQYAYLSDPSFGEQVIIQGCDSSQIAIGDVFEVEGGFSKLVIEVSAPRKPGYSLDRRHGTPMGEHGIKRHCLTNGLAGWFTRVLVTGELREGMTLIRTKHPNPKWTLSYISNALYGEGDTATVNRCQGHWKRSKRELIEMINLPQLGNHQWKDEGKKVLAKMETENEARIGNRICSSSVVRFMTRCFYN
jgi:MOSC domain-containing protein YiiM